MKKVDIIIIKGAPATGKTQTAKELAKYFPNGVRIEVDNLRSMVISVDWTNQEEHINVLNISAKLVLEFHTLGYKPIIVVDTFSGNKFVEFHKKLMEIDSNLKIQIFGLFSTSEEIKKRIEMRNNDEFKDLRISLQINEETRKNIYKEEFQIDTTDLNSKETAQRIFNALENR